MAGHQRGDLAPRVAIAAHDFFRLLVKAFRSHEADGLERLFLRREIIVEARLPDPENVRNVLGRSAVEAFGSEHVRRRIENFRPTSTRSRSAFRNELPPIFPGPIILFA